MKIANKTIVVTGAARGIGKYLAAEFIRQNANVVIADKRGSKIQETASALGALGVLCDVTKENQIKRLVKKVSSKLGPIDFFVSNAGVNFGEKNHAASASNQTWNRCWNVHVMAHVYAARAVLPTMIKRKQGYFVQIISAAALLSQIGDSAYSSTKHAALGFAESLAITHNSDGIRVSAVCPQYVSTEMLGYNSNDEIFLCSVKSPQEVAKLVISGIKSEKFLILPHPEVYEFMNFKTKSYDKWIHKMSKLRSKLLKRYGTLNIKAIHKFIS